MAFWQRAYEGEIMVDHRASPGLPEHIARLCGYDTQQCGEGKLFEAPTLYCSHCRRRLMRNPGRNRERAFCLHCSNHYICDWCDEARNQPGYVHKPFEAVVEETLKWQSASSPVLRSPLRPPLILAPPSPVDKDSE